MFFTNIIIKSHAVSKIDKARNVGTVMLAPAFPRCNADEKTEPIFAGLKMMQIITRMTYVITDGRNIFR